jgi:DNA polymerase III alpha subunit
MENIPRYIAVRHGEEKPDYLHPKIEGILKETHGIMIYQEQVMQIAQVLAGYTLGGADLLRRAMGKKIQSEMDAQRKSFVDGAVARGVVPGKAEQIFDQMAKFAGYGFNKSHAAAYGLVAYQTAYLKANYPVEFLAASMTLDLGNTDKLNHFRQELSRLGIALLPPDINRSDVAFSVETDPPSQPSPASGGGEGRGNAPSYEYEPEEVEILDELLPRNIAVQVFRALLENAASEQGSRMSAMDNATRNAGEMIRKQTITYNRTRQAMITKELIEIISGAEAL